MALRGDAQADRISRATNLPSITSWTAMGWFLRSGTGTGLYESAFAFGSTTSTYAVYLRYSGNANFALTEWSADYAGSAIVDGEWNHIAVTCSGTGASQLLGYFNGRLDITANAAAITGTTLYCLGHANGGASDNEWFNGRAAYVGIWSGVLSGNEIRAQMYEPEPVARLAQLNSWSQFRRTDDFYDYSKRGNVWTVNGTLATEDGPPLVQVRQPRRKWFVLGTPQSANAYTLAADAGSVSITGTAATLKAARLVTASAGSVAITGTAASLLRGYPLTAGAGSIAITGQAASLLATRTITASAGSVAITGAAASLLRGYPLTASAGSVAISGTAATLLATRVLTASAGSVSITGTAASLLYGHVLTASAGSVAITGQDATLTYTQPGNFVLTANGGSVAITGTAASLLAGHAVTASAGSITLTGAAAGLLYGHTVAASAGSVAITGQDVTFSRTYALTAQSGSVSISGSAAALRYSGEVAPVPAPAASGGGGGGGGSASVRWQHPFPVPDAQTSEHTGSIGFSFSLRADVSHSQAPRILPTAAQPFSLKCHSAEPGEGHSHAGTVSLPYTIGVRADIAYGAAAVGSVDAAWKAVAIVGQSVTCPGLIGLKVLHAADMGIGSTQATGYSIRLFVGASVSSGREVASRIGLPVHKVVVREVEHTDGNVSRRRILRLQEDAALVAAGPALWR